MYQLKKELTAQANTIVFFFFFLFPFVLFFFLCLFCTFFVPFFLSVLFCHVTSVSNYCVCLWVCVCFLAVVVRSVCLFVLFKNRGDIVLPTQDIVVMMGQIVQCAKKQRARHTRVGWLVGWLVLAVQPNIAFVFLLPSPMRLVPPSHISHESC